MALFVHSVDDDNDDDDNDTYSIVHATELYGLYENIIVCTQLKYASLSTLICKY